MLALLLLVVVLGKVPHVPVDFRYDADIHAAVANTAAVFPVPPSLVRAIIRQESGFNPRARSKVGALGLMQVMPFNARKLGFSEAELWLPERNIHAGVRLLAVLLRHYEGDVVAALVAYNSGPKRKHVVPNNGETPGYVVAVLRAWKRYAKLEADGMLAQR